MEIVYRIVTVLALIGIGVFIRVILDSIKRLSEESGEYIDILKKLISITEDKHDALLARIGDIEHSLRHLMDEVEACAKCERIIYQKLLQIETITLDNQHKIRDIDDYINMTGDMVIPTILDTYKFLTERSSTMTINEYQQMALRTESPTTDEVDRILQGAMGLCGESGEYIDILKKHMFQGHDLDKEHMAKELGDIAWYLAVSADAINYDLETIFQMNIDKLKARYPEGFETGKSTNRRANDI